MCHGREGRGDGDVAKDRRPKIRDFSSPSELKSRSDGELFYIIKNGKAQMPPEGERTKADEIWDLVNYIRTLPKPAADSLRRQQ